jgi:hypothetical protein
MRISGHKTRSVFDRYDIVSESDLVDAAPKVERGARSKLAQSGEIHSSYLAEAEVSTDAGNENARKPV